MPKPIQFKNGCQIKHTYTADGQKLSSRYVTVNAGVYQPLNPGQIIENLDVNENDNVTVDGMDYIGSIEYQIYRYFDWDVTFEPAELKYIFRVHNPEGFATNTTTTNGPIYRYYRKDHLGNNREVWRASYTWGSTTHPAATVQRTQYYPSGLPWKTNSGDNPGSQPYKYGGKEFVEMHGLDEYDSEARWYYPAIMRTTTMDPLAEKYYDISPYAWCGNNPMRYIDPFGMDYWSTNNPDEIERFLRTIGWNTNRNPIENFDFSSWNHSTDAEFIGNLTYNDESKTFYSSYGTVENGVFTKVGVSIKASGEYNGSASIPNHSTMDWWQKSSGRIDQVNVEFGFLVGISSPGRALIKTICNALNTPVVSTNNTINAFNGFKVGGNKEKMGKAKGNMSGNRVVQQKQFDSVVSKLKLNKNQANQLHDYIHGEGYGYNEILQIAKEMFNK